MNETLRRFIQEALAKGISRPEIETALFAAHWPKDEVGDGLDAFADVEFPLPVPRPSPSLSARDAFTYLVLFTLLYLSAWNLGTLYFEFIHRAWPDATRSTASDYSLRTIRWALATLFISFPGYLLLSVRVHRATRAEFEQRNSKVRKWLTYLTLFITAGVMLGDLIQLLYNMLDGELTVRFLLKALVVAALAASVFCYYFWELRADDARPRSATTHPVLRAFIGTVSTVVAIGLVGGFLATGSPGRARELRLDDVRESHLRQIVRGIDGYWENLGELPESLATLETTRGYSVPSISDPESRLPYGYRITGERSYELCARFAAASEEATDTGFYYRSYGNSKFWKHAPGHACFSIEVTQADN